MIKIFNHYFHRRTVLQVFLDMGLVVGALMLALYTQSQTEQGLMSRAVVLEGLSRGVLIALGLLAVNAALGFYERGYNGSVHQMRSRAVLSFLLSGLIAAGVLWLLPLAPPFDRTWLTLVVLGTTGFMLTHRVLVGDMLPGSLARRRLVVYGTGERARAVARSLHRSSADLLGHIASPNEAEQPVASRVAPAPGERLDQMARRLRVDEIVVALGERRGGSMPLRALLDCKLQGIQVTDIATYFERNLGQIRLDAMSAGWLIFGEGFNQGLWRTAVKRVFDIAGALLLIALTWPLMLLSALAIKLESRGPVLYRQQRVGLNGQPFDVVKFRSMRTDAEQDGVPRWASAADSRVTRVGRVMRKLRIDELPQLFGVLVGRMSLVGPRPERPYFVEQLTQDIPFYAVRHSVKPGVTGWAQVNYQYGASREDTVQKLQYDLYYVKTHSLFLDLVILFETVGVVLTGKGAQ
jgi:sugar transferase (PEP-CTERM system associated)